jgi:hypothetical protein
LGEQFVLQGSSRRFCIGGEAAISPTQLALAVFEKFLLKAQLMYG